MTVAPAWWRLEMAAPAELEESLLWKLQSLGISRLALQHHPEAPQERQLLAWLPEIDWSPQQRQALRLALEPLGEPFGLELPPLRWQRQEEEDWSLSWKRHWQADPIGERLLVLPAWLDCPPEQADRLVIRIDPGSAFGTGSHPTSRLCLEALEQLAARPGGLAGRRVADLGCGSGLLALAALRLGADEAVAADIDSMAVSATIANASLNGLHIPVEQGSVERLEELLAGRPADVLLCNILAPVIEALAPSFGRILAPGGVGLLSGLLVGQVAGLQRALADAGWKARLTARSDPWGLLTLESSDHVA